MSNFVQAQRNNRFFVFCINRIWIFTLILGVSPLIVFSDLNAQESDPFNDALKERMELQRKTDSLQYLNEQIGRESSTLRGKVAEFNSNRDSVSRQAKYIAKKITFENELIISRKGLEELKIQKNIALADPEVRKIDDSLRYLNSRKNSLTKTRDSLNRISVTKTRDYRKDSIYQGYVAELRKTVKLISDENIKRKFENNIQPTLEQMRSVAQNLLKPSSFYDSLKINQAMTLTTSINNNLQLNALVSALYGEITHIHHSLTILNRANQLLSKPYRKKEIQEALVLLQPLQGLDSYDLTAINNEITELQNYLRSYCSVNAVFWKAYNEAVNPIPAVSAEMLGELEKKLDRRYTYLSGFLTASKRNSQAGKRITQQNTTTDPCQ